MSTAPEGFLCAGCGRWHAELPFSFSIAAPAPYAALPEAERERRAFLGPEQCEIDGRFFFVRGNILIPVHDAPGPFGYTVWVSLSERNYARMADLWQSPERVNEPPYFGWLSVQLGGYPPTLNLKTLAHTQPMGQRPLIELEPTDHPLAVEQREGITLARVREIAALHLHGRPDR